MYPARPYCTLLIALCTSRPIDFTVLCSLPRLIRMDSRVFPFSQLSESAPGALGWPPNRYSAEIRAKQTSCLSDSFSLSPRAHLQSLAEVNHIMGSTLAWVVLQQMQNVLAKPMFWHKRRSWKQQCSASSGRKVRPNAVKQASSGPQSRHLHPYQTRGLPASALTYK